MRLNAPQFKLKTSSSELGAGGRRETLNVSSPRQQDLMGHCAVSCLKMSDCTCYLESHHLANNHPLLAKHLGNIMMQHL